MKKKMRDYLENRILNAKNSVHEVWAKTEDFTPEDAICSAILTNMNALLRILERVKTED